MILDLQKLFAASQDVHVAVNLGVAAISGYMEVSRGTLTELCYQLYKWQNKLGKGTMPGLDKLISVYEDWKEYQFVKEMYFKAREEMEGILSKMEGRLLEETYYNVMHMVVGMFDADDDGLEGLKNLFEHVNSGASSPKVSEKEAAERREMEETVRQIKLYQSLNPDGWKKVVS